MLCFRLLSIAISRYVLFLCHMFMLHLWGGGGGGVVFVLFCLFVCVCLSVLGGGGCVCVFVCLFVCLFFLHLYCSVQLSMFNMEKRYRNKVAEKQLFLQQPGPVFTLDGVIIAEGDIVLINGIVHTISDVLLTEDLEAITKRYLAERDISHDAIVEA